MRVRYVDYAKDYPDLCDWWADWDWPAIPVESLPATGLIVENKGTKLCAVFLYRTDSDICSPEWFITNRNAPKELRGGAMDFLLDGLEKEAKKQGFSKMFASVSAKGRFLKKLIARGWHSRVDENMINIVKVL